MTSYELVLRVEHDCPYTKFTANLPKAVVMHWCSNKKDVLQISTPPEISSDGLERQIDQLVRNLRAKIIRNIRVEQDIRILAYKHNFSTLKQNVNEVIERCNCVEIQPTVYRDGSEWYRIVAFTQVDVMALHQILSQFARVKTVSQTVHPDASLKSSVMIASSSILGKLTKKQQSALLTAVSMGYFDIPPKTSTEAMAGTYGVARTTFEEHLRKAEEKILKSLLPYLEMQ